MKKLGRKKDTSKSEQDEPTASDQTLATEITGCEDQRYVLRADHDAAKDWWSDKQAAFRRKNRRFGA